jgi:inosine-uridine nucleoside N-ribohydrolase
MSEKLIIDADTGVGDALAIALALADPEVDLLAVTAVGGCVSATQAGRNLVSIIEAIDPPRRPRLGVNDSPETAYEQAQFSERMGDAAGYLKKLHGESGLGDWQDRGAELHHPRSSSKLLSELTREFPGEITLVTLGPLTSLALTSELDGEFFGRLKRLVCLGGTLQSPGDVGPVSEFNVAFQPEAARRVLRHPERKTLVPLDISRRLMLTFEQIQRLKLSDATGAGRLVSSLLTFSLRAHHQHLGVEGVCLPEVMALVAAVHPRFFHGQEMACDVELSGTLTRGMTVFDRRVHPAWRTKLTVLSDVELQGVMDYVLGMLGRCGS